MDIFDLLDVASLAVNGKYKRRKDREKGFWHWLDHKDDDKKDVIRVSDDYAYGMHTRVKSGRTDVTVTVRSNDPISVSVEVF